MKPILEIQDLSVEVESKKVLHHVNLSIQKGEVHALMGRNGSGKTSLSYTLMGHPKYRVTSGRILLDGEDLAGMSPSDRAKRRLFLAFQNPVAVPGVTIASFLRTSIRSVRGDEVPAKEVRKLIREELAGLGISETFMSRFVNDGLSGGEKKRLETLQLRLLQPKVAILDETDSGLDVDALKAVTSRIESLRSPDRSFLLITHYQRMLEAIRPDVVHILMDGTIVKTGDASLAKEIDEQGFQSIHEASAQL